MRNDPLRPPPPDSPLGPAFLRCFGLERGEPDAAFLEAVAGAFARIPYENVTKIIKQHREGNPERAYRGPGEVMGDHVRFGAGGTCFSLTALLMHLLRAFGYEVQPVLADRPYGPDTHCAVIVTLAGVPHLLDPGYLVLRPIPLDGVGTVRVPTPFNDIILKSEEGGRLALSTSHQGNEAYRLSFKLPGADGGAFMRAWRESFSWDMMRYPVVTGVREGRQLYVQKTHFQERDRDGVARSVVNLDDLPRVIARRFGLAPEVTAQALDIVRRREKLDA